MVINEVYLDPAEMGVPVSNRFLEILNISKDPVDTTDWQLCYQTNLPSSSYLRLVSNPNDILSGFIMQPGDFLILHANAGSGSYFTEPNSMGSTTHHLNLGPPDICVPESDPCDYVVLEANTG